MWFTTLSHRNRFSCSYTQLVASSATGSTTVTASVLYGASRFQLDRLQSILNAQRRGSGWGYRSSLISRPALIRSELHWLPVRFWPEFKICLFDRSELSDRRRPGLPSETLRFLKRRPSEPSFQWRRHGGNGRVRTPHFCSDPSWDLRKSVEKCFIYRGGGGCPMHVFCNFLLLTSKEKLFGPPTFFGLATPLLRSASRGDLAIVPRADTTRFAGGAVSLFLGRPFGTPYRRKFDKSWTMLNCSRKGWKHSTCKSNSNTSVVKRGCRFLHCRHQCCSIGAGWLLVRLKGRCVRRIWKWKIGSIKQKSCVPLHGWCKWICQKNIIRNKSKIL